VLKAYDRFSVDAVNVSAHDLTFIAPLMGKSDFTLNSKNYPLLNRLVSANIVADSPAMVAPQKFIVREVMLRGAPAGSKPFRIAFIGIAEKLEDVPVGFHIADPVESLRAIAPEARKKADYVIVLAHIKPDDAPHIAREAPGIDVMLVGGTHLDRVFIPPVFVGKTFVAYSAYETRMLGELRLYPDAENRFSVRSRYISIDEAIPGDPAAEETVIAATAADERTRAEGKQLLESWLVMSRGRTKPPAEGAAGSTPQYVSSGVCGRCHTAQHIQWANSRHRYASDPLANKGYEFEASCLTCHASGGPMGENKLPQFQGVQCEQCHGPGSLHVAKPEKGYGRITDMNATCSNCHTSKTSPSFNLAAAWEKIKH
jgi:hypothetical protein